MQLAVGSGGAFDNFRGGCVDLRVRETKVGGSLPRGAFMAWKWTGFIDQGVTLEGTLQLTGTFRINGNVKGNIISEQTVILGEGAKVEGQIEGNRVVIAGRFDGVIFAKGRVEIQAKGVVTGEVHSPCMVVDPGGIFDGRCHMLASSDATSGVTIPIRALGKA
jgi:cytoskeletal protein CcmA (bactofilin family)